MPGFEKPSFEYPYKVDKELAALRAHKGAREVPQKLGGSLLLVTWNIANLGVQERHDEDYQLIAEIISWFDLIALQEVNNDLEGLREIEKQLPDRYRTIFSDPGGNNERFAFLYDEEKVKLLEEIGRVTVPPKDLPYIHLYFGKNKDKGTEEAESGIERRCLEAYAVGRWADLRREDDDAYTKNVLALGDFNLPKRDKSDPVFAALTTRGLYLPEYPTKVPGSNLDSAAQYDQMAVFPGPMKSAIKQNGVFDFDNALFPGLWGKTEDEQNKFQSFVKYYISDHRPLWAELTA